MKELFTIWTNTDYQELTHNEFITLSEEKKIAVGLFNTFRRPVRVFKCEEVPESDQSVWARVRDYMPTSRDAAYIEEDFKDRINNMLLYNESVNNTFYDGFRGSKLGHWSYYFFINDRYYVSIKQGIINVYIINRDDQGLWPLKSRPGYEC